MRLEPTTRLRASRPVLFLAATFAGLLLVAAAPMAAQTGAETVPIRLTGLARNQTPLFEFTVGYSFLHANAPAGQCGCFSVNQGFGTFEYHLPQGIGLIADISGGHANHISGTPQSITLIDSLFGMRYGWKLPASRYTLYGQALLGLSSESSNYAYAQSLKGFAILPGGGVNIRLSPHFAWNAEAGWLHSDLANAANDRQNDLRIATGITLRFAPR